MFWNHLYKTFVEQFNISQNFRAIWSYTYDCEKLNGSKTVLWSWFRKYWEIEWLVKCLIQMISKHIEVPVTSKVSFFMGTPYAHAKSLAYKWTFDGHKLYNHLYNWWDEMLRACLYKIESSCEDFQKSKYQWLTSILLFPDIHTGSVYFTAVYYMGHIIYDPYYIELCHMGHIVKLYIVVAIVLP